MSQKVSSQGFEYGVKHFSNSTSGLLTHLIAEILELTQTEVQLLLNLGAIYLNQQRQNTDLLIEENQIIRVHTKPRRYNCQIDWKSRVVFESADFVILNKPSGIPSHPSVDNRIENSLDQLSKALNHPLLITHRLDTLTEGLIVYAKTILFVKSFNHQLQNHQIEKKYCAVVETFNSLPAKLIHYMEPSPRAPKTVSQVALENGLLCELEILEQKKHQVGSWIKINLLTGRTHQIRAQLSNLEAPILGDRLYGSVGIWKENAIALRACELQFNWNGQLMQFKLDTEFLTD
jgi:23S rRNA pseudouridine1911/1915/1917 synthase